MIGRGPIATTTCRHKGRTGLEMQRHPARDRENDRVHEAVAVRMSGGGEAGEAEPLPVVRDDQRDRRERRRRRRLVIKSKSHAGFVHAAEVLPVGTRLVLVVRFQDRGPMDNLSVSLLVVVVRGGAGARTATSAVPTR